MPDYPQPGRNSFSADEEQAMRVSQRAKNKSVPVPRPNPTRPEFNDLSAGEVDESSGAKSNETRFPKNPGVYLQTPRKDWKDTHPLLNQYNDKPGRPLPLSRGKDVLI